MVVNYRSINDVIYLSYKLFIAKIDASKIKQNDEPRG